MIQIRNTHPIGYSTSQQEIRRSNMILLFNLIRDHMPISRTELTRICPLAASTISYLVDDLLGKGWITESESVHSSARGRKSRLLSINDQIGYIATVELLDHGYICTIYNLCLKKTCSTRVRNTTFDAFTIAGTINSLLKSARVSANRLLGINMIFPGVVDSVSGFLVSSPVFPDNEMPDRFLCLQLQKIFPNAEVMIVTNGMIIAFEQFMLCSDRSTLPLFSLNIDEAIFGGVVMSTPDNDMNCCIPIEIGHFTVDCHGSLCRCGNRGCMETVCKTPVLFQTLNRKAGLDLTYSNRFGSDCNVTSMLRVAEELNAGNDRVIEVLRDYTAYVCYALISVINGFGIKSVHIGGDIALLGNGFLDILEDVFRTRFHALNTSYPVRFELYNTDYEQARLAAATICLDKIFKEK
ncbi:MAG: ROK family transcriptional regulator [Clostridia bacterium]|nr:ROK family transcriptional regulator [Clostridia bacterium]